MQSRPFLLPWAGSVILGRRPGRAGRRPSVILFLVCLPLLTAACAEDDARIDLGPPTDTASDVEEQRVPPPSARTRIREVVDEVEAPHAVSVAAAEGGSLTPVDGVAGAPALRFPDHDPAVDGARAVIRLRTVEPSPEALNPGPEPFTFGADVRLAEGPTASSGADNGDNVMQRGLFADAGQFKLEVDGGRVLCRVKGSVGAVSVRGPEVSPGVWYRMSCERRGSTVRLSVSRLTPDGLADEVTEQDSGPVGSVDFRDETPVSVGGKLTDGGGIVTSASDQFNGTIARVQYSRLG